MRWGNPLLSILLSLHYTTNYVGCNLSTTGRGTHFNKNSKKARSASNNHSNSSFSDIFLSHTFPVKNCVDNNSTMCNQSSNYWQSNSQHQYDIPGGISSTRTNEYKQFQSTPKRKLIPSVQNYYNYDNYGGGNSGYGYNFEDPNANTQPILQHQPVYYYVDPLQSRGDENGHSSDSHSGANKGHHHHDSSTHAMKPHGEHGYESTPHQENKGWGWPHHQEHHHHDKKHKKKKKGVLGKLLKKFKPHKKPEKLIWKEVPECDGFENFIKDLEIIGWIFGLVGFAKATIGLILHFLNQVYLTVSVIKIGFPERLLTFIELQNPGTTPEMLKMITEIIGLIDYVINLFGSYPLGNKIVVIEFIAEILTIISLALATITIFDDIIEEKVWTIFGIDLRELFEGYGCHNPFSKEKKIEQLFEKFKKW